MSHLKVLCDNCGFTCTDRRKFNEHLKAHLFHEFDCDQCDSRFKTKRRLSDHKQYGHGQKEEFQILVQLRTLVDLCSQHLLLLLLLAKFFSLYLELELQTS